MVRGGIGMNTLWSTQLQTAETLYQTRRLRFDDRFREHYTRVFGLDDSRSILEIGAGPGALTQALARWYPNAEVTGSDRDSAFVAFAQARAPHIKFIEADIAALPFDGDCFDAVISHTVHEHVEPGLFFGAQYRVLKPGGVCLVLSAGRRTINLAASDIMEPLAFETEMRQRTEPYYQAADEAHCVGKYRCSEQELPTQMRRQGFEDIQTHYLAINLTPDSAQYDRDFALRMIEANRRVHLDSLAYLPHIAPGVVSEAERKRWAAEINAKYDKRVAKYLSGEPQWDVNVSVTMAVRGVKPR